MREAEGRNERQDDGQVGPKLSVEARVALFAHLVEPESAPPPLFGSGPEEEPPA